MRRIAVLSVLLLGIDQATKTVAQLAFPETSTAAWRACREAGLDCADVVFAPGWGLVYIEHAGFWVWSAAPPLVVYGAHLLVLVVWLGVLAAGLWYRRWYRVSLAVDLSVAFFTVAAWGNLLDRLLVGGARDWLVTPVAVANLADVAVWPALALLTVEVWRFPPARGLLRAGLSFDPRKIRRP